jgi:hypothetical protein
LQSYFPTLIFLFGAALFTASSNKTLCDSENNVNHQKDDTADLDPAAWAKDYNKRKKI